MHGVKKISGAVMWANLHLLFWLSLISVATAWAGETNFASAPVAVYGIVLVGCAFAYTLLQECLVRANGRDSDFAKALGKDVKGKVSLAIYVVAVPFAWFYPVVSCIFFIGVALIWLVPDRRFERDL